MFPNGVPIDRDAPSPEPLVCLFIHSFMYVCQSPQKGALLHMGKNIRSPYTEPHTDGRPTYNGVRPGSLTMPSSTVLVHTLLLPLDFQLANNFKLNTDSCKDFKCVFVPFSTTDIVKIQVIWDILCQLSSSQCFKGDTAL